MNCLVNHVERLVDRVGADEPIHEDPAFVLRRGEAKLLTTS
jgi:hypothetical protein